MSAPGSKRLRVAMYVDNDASRDTRVLREADALAAAGHDVVLVARLAAGVPLPIEEQRPSGVRLVRIPRDNGPEARWRSVQQRAGYPWRARGVLVRGLLRDLRAGPPGWVRAGATLLATFVALPWIAYRLLAYKLIGDRAPGMRRRGQLDYIMSWRRSVYPWADAAAGVVPDADVHHGHDLTGLVAAVAAADGTPALVVYDSHELYPESGRHARQGRLARKWLRSLERRLAQRAVALVTVNRTLEEILRKNLGFTRSVVVHNAPPRWTPPDPAPDLLRARLGLPLDAHILLYHGRLAEVRGLQQLVEAVLRPGMDDVHLVFLGYGPLRDELAARAADPGSGGRVHLLDAVPPDELAAWVASADVGVMPNQPVNANERLSTPNKLFESMAVGLPVVSSDFPERRRIILEDPGGRLGAVCDPTSPDAIATAIRSIVDLSAAERAALRSRILRAAHERWNWESESARLVALYEELAAERSS
jgi:glycosyltransferase involved in cell wall biosynthesis